MSEDRSSWEIGQEKEIDGELCILTKLEILRRKSDIAEVWHATRPDGSSTATVQFKPKE